MIVGLEIGPQAPRVEGVEKAMHRFALRNVESGAIFVIEVLGEIRSATPDTSFNVKRSGFEWELRTEKLDDTSALDQIEFDSF